MDISVSEFKILVCIEDRLNQLKYKTWHMEEEDLISKDDVLGILKDMTFEEALNIPIRKWTCEPIRELTGEATEQIVKIPMEKFEIYITEKVLTDLIFKRVVDGDVESKYLYVREITEFYSCNLFKSANKANHRALEGIEEEIKDNAGADQEDE